MFSLVGIFSCLLAKAEKSFIRVASYADAVWADGDEFIPHVRGGGTRGTRVTLFFCMNFT